MKTGRDAPPAWPSALAWFTLVASGLALIALALWMVREPERFVTARYGAAPDAATAMAERADERMAGRPADVDDARALALERTEPVDVAPPTTDPPRVASDATAADGPVRGYEARRAEELAGLSGLSARVRFASGSDALTPGARDALDRVFEPLFLYPETDVTVAIRGRDGLTPIAEHSLARRRAAAIVDYLTARGLGRDRLDIAIDIDTARGRAATGRPAGSGPALSGPALSGDGQRVSISAVVSRS